MTRRAPSIRALNQVGRWLSGIGVDPVKLDAERLLATASRRAGLGDYGDDGFREALARFLDACDAEAQLHLLGRIAVQQEALRTLENRLLLIEERKRRPQIAEERVEKPLFIVGMPRTGTSILHELLALDPENRCPLTWEVMWPTPPPSRETYRSDPRIERTTRLLAGTDKVLPEFKAMHRMGAELPQECCMLMNHDFMSMQFHTSYSIPSYQDWLDRQQMIPVYEFHRRQLQHLQVDMPAEHWVLKSPQHLWSMDALLAVYPDAQIVHTHRDPVRVVASVASLVALLRSMCSDEVDTLALGADWLDRIATALDRSLAVREEVGDRGGSIFDMPFQEYLADPLAMVGRIYRHFGRELSEVAAERMSGYLQSHPPGEHGRHVYRAEDYGLEPAAVRDRLKRYQDHFAIPSE